jgi:hypothetical protein
MNPAKFDLVARNSMPEDPAAKSGDMALKTLARKNKER